MFDYNHSLSLMTFFKSLVILYMSIFSTLSCTPEDPIILYSTQEVLATVFGDTLPLYEACEIAEDFSSEEPQGFIIPREYLDPCSIDHMAQCEQGDEDFCESTPPKCFQDASQARFCTKLCETDEDCPQNGRCVFSNNKRGSSLIKFKLEQVRNVFSSNNDKICVNQAWTEETNSRLLEQVGHSSLPKEYDSCDPEADIDLCKTYYEIGCLSKSLPDEQCSGVETKSPVSCVEVEGSESEGVCLRSCRNPCLNGDVCDDDGYCSPAK